MPRGAQDPYLTYTVDIYPNWQSLMTFFGPTFQDRWKKVHPDVPIRKEWRRNGRWTRSNTRFSIKWYPKFRLRSNLDELGRLRGPRRESRGFLFFHAPVNPLCRGVGYFAGVVVRMPYSSDASRLWREYDLLRGSHLLQFNRVEQWVCSQNTFGVRSSLSSGISLLEIYGRQTHPPAQTPPDSSRPPNAV